MEKLSNPASTNQASRRKFLKLPVAAAAMAPSLPARPVIDEHDPSNIKLCRRLRSDIAEDDLLFLRQIGLRWARVNFSGQRRP